MPKNAKRAGIVGCAVNADDQIIAPTDKHAKLAAGGSVGSVALLLAFATAMWQVMLLTAAIWFSGAVTITLINVFTGLLTDGKRRGASFVLLFMAYPLGAVIGGSAVGQLHAWYGYAPVFVVLAAGWTAQPPRGDRPG